MAPSLEQVEALRDAYGGRARKESQIRQDYGGLARDEARKMGEIEADAAAKRMADWQDTVDTDAALQEREFAAKAQRAADWQDTVDTDAALQARAPATPAETPWAQVQNPYAAKAAALREARGLPPIGVGPVQEQPAGLVGAQGEPLLLRATGAPVLEEQPMDVSRSPVVQAYQAVKAALPSGPVGGRGGVLDPAREVAPVGPPMAAPPAAAPAAPPVAPPVAAAPAAAPPQAIFRQPPPDVGGRPVGNDRAAIVAQAIWDERNAALERAARGTPYYKIAATPEREQATDVHRERALGYDPAILERQFAIESDPNKLTEEAARPQQAPRVAYDPRVLATMIAAPPEAKTQAQRDAFYAGLAEKAAADGVSLRGLLASGDVRLAAPRTDLKPLDEAEAKVYSDAHKAAFASIVEPFAATGVDLRAPENARLIADADRDAKLAASDALNRDRIMANAGAIDETNATTRRLFDEGEAQRLRQVEAKRSTNEENFGTRGQLGFEQEKLRLEAQAHEATADAERAMAKVAGDAVAEGEKLRAKADADKPGVMQSILGVIGAGLGAFGQGMVGGPNQYIEAARHRIESQAKSLTEDVAVQKGIEISRYEQIKHNLQAKLAEGMSETAQNAAKQMVGQIELRQIAAMKELSAMTRGSEKVASKVIPAQAARIGGGPGPNDRLKTLLAMRGDEEAMAKLAKEQGGEAPKKSEKPEVGVLNGMTYELRNVTSSTEGHEARKLLRTWDGIDASVKQLEEAAQSYGQRGYNPARLEFLANQVGAKLSIASGQGVVTNPEAERNVKAFSSWVDPKAVVRDVRKMLQDDRNAMLSQLGAAPARKR